MLNREVSVIVRPRKYPAPPPTGMIDVPEACSLLGMSKTTLYRYMKEPGFPQPTKQAGQTWFNKAELQAWKDQQQTSSSSS
jgi:predicted DNA-binding transcriptional regulator AlpA